MPPLGKFFDIYDRQESLIKSDVDIFYKTWQDNIDKNEAGYSIPTVKEWGDFPKELFEWEE